MLKNKKEKIKGKNEDILEDEEVKEEEEGKGKKKRSESVEKRKKAKELDRAARWSGLIMLIVLMMVGFLLWVSGQMNKEKKLDNTSQFQYVTPGYSDEF